MHRLYRATWLALALSLALVGGAFAGASAGAEFELTSEATVAGVGPGDAVTIDLSATGLVSAKNLDVVIELSDPSAFDLDAVTLTMTGGVLAGWIVPGNGLLVSGTTNRVRVGAANLTSTSTGDGTFRIGLTTSASFTGETEATVTVASISVGEGGGATPDVFTPAFEVTVNPPVSDPTLTAATPTDASLDFSAVGSGDTEDGSAGEATLGVIFRDVDGTGASGQTILWTVNNNGAETIYVLATTVTAVEAGGSATVSSISGNGGASSILLDAEGDKFAGSTSATITAETTADNSEGATLNLSVDFSVTWDVPVPAELASFAGDVTADKDVHLRWAVASQTNNLGWEVFRSVDNRVFTRVSTLIPGEGTLDELREYSFVDAELPAADVVYYYLRQIDLNGTASRSSVIEVALAPTSVQDQSLPLVTALSQNYPNPFNPETTIQFDLASEVPVTLKVYDITGQVVRTLVRGSLPAGSYTELWDGLNASGVKVGSGVYFYELRAGSFTSMKKMTLLQ